MMIEEMRILKNLQILSKEEQKKVKGGITLSCKCNNSLSYRWIGEYASYKDAEADFKTYCGYSSATCIHVEV